MWVPAVLLLFLAVPVLFLLRLFVPFLLGLFLLSAVLFVKLQTEFLQVRHSLLRLEGQLEAFLEGLKGHQEKEVARLLAFSKASLDLLKPANIIRNIASIMILFASRFLVGRNVHLLAQCVFIVVQC